MTAYGRDVDVPESLLSYDRATRRLRLAGGSRQHAAVRDALADVHALLKAEPRSTNTHIADTLRRETEHTRADIRAAVKAGLRDGSIITEKGPKHSTLHSLSSEYDADDHARKDEPLW